MISIYLSLQVIISRLCCPFMLQLIWFIDRKICRLQVNLCKCWRYIIHALNTALALARGPVVCTDHFPKLEMNHSLSVCRLPCNTLQYSQQLRKYECKYTQLRIWTTQLGLLINTLSRQTFQFKLSSLIALYCIVIMIILFLILHMLNCKLLL